jgi:hypothetical protein
MEKPLYLDHQHALALKHAIEEYQNHPSRNEWPEWKRATVDNLVTILRHFYQTVDPTD